MGEKKIIKNYTFRYGIREDRKMTWTEIVEWLLFSIIFIGLGILIFKKNSQVLFILKLISAVLFIIIGLITLTILIISITKEHNYIYIDNESIRWKQGLFDNKKEIKLSALKTYEIKNQFIYLMQNNGSPLTINMDKIISSKKKKEITRIFYKLKNKSHG